MVLELEVILRASYSIMDSYKDVRLCLGPWQLRTGAAQILKRKDLKSVTNWQVVAFSCLKIHFNFPWKGR